MKHIILHGGRPWLADDGGERWVRALLRQCEHDARIAFCLFAQETTEWDDTIAINDKTLGAYAGDIRVEHKVLTAENFQEVSRWANIILIPGGDPAPLKQALERQGDVLQLWDGKTISGHSAGADVFVRRYMYLQDKTVQEGFGWLPLNFIPHWQADILGWTSEDWRWAAAELAGKPGDVPLLTLPEADFAEFALQ